MPNLSPKARRATADIQAAISEGRTRDALTLIREYGLSHGDRIAVAAELDRRARVPDGDDHVQLRFDAFDRCTVEAA